MNYIRRALKKDRGITMTKDYKLMHVCEVCGKTEILTPDEAFEAGWDYPPRMGSFGVISPRTCGDCTIDRTLYWALMAGGIKNREALSETQKETLDRILNEPYSIIPIGTYSE